MAASNFANPQFQTSPAKQVQAPVVQAPQQSGSGLKGVLTGLAQLGMGIATDNPALMAQGASGAVLGPKAGQLAGGLANAATGNLAGAMSNLPTGGAGSAAKSVGSTAQAAGTAAAAPQADTSSGGTTPAANTQQPGGFDPMMFLLQAFGLLPKSPQPPQNGQGWGP